MLTGVSSRQAVALELNSKKRTYIIQMRHSLGWMQEIINATLLAGCTNIRQLGHDGGSISEVETLCVSTIITDITTVRETRSGNRCNNKIFDRATQK